MNIMSKKTNGNLNFCIKTNVDLNSIINFLLILLKISFLIKNKKYNENAIKDNKT